MAVDAIHEDYKDPEGLRRFLLSRNTERCGKCTAEAVRMLFVRYNENFYMDAMLRRMNLWKEDVPEYEACLHLPS